MVQAPRLATADFKPAVPHTSRPAPADGTAARRRAARRRPAKDFARIGCAIRPRRTQENARLNSFRRTRLPPMPKWFRDSSDHASVRVAAPLIARPMNCSLVGPIRRRQKGLADPELVRRLLERVKPKTSATAAPPNWPTCYPRPLFHRSTAVRGSGPGSKVCGMAGLKSAVANRAA